MSGTSADGIDAVIAEFDGDRFIRVIGSSHTEYAAEQRAQLLTLSLNQPAITLRELSLIDIGIADRFASAAQHVLSATGIEARQIRAIGSHGQTVFHEGPRGLTMQLGDPSRIAAQTGITTVADFRRRDLALGGQGAPLVPAFHHALFAADEPRCVLNIGGIANVTLLPNKTPQAVRGFDTGPGNALMDEWVHLHHNVAYDVDGAFGARGAVHLALLDALLTDPYFAAKPPKSTGRDYFRLTWARRLFPALDTLDPRDVQATLCELTAVTVAQAIHSQGTNWARVLVCGGGARNLLLQRRLQALLGPKAVLATTDGYGLGAELIEATAFAWLAMRTLAGGPGNLPAVTGASKPAILGGIYPA